MCNIGYGSYKKYRRQERTALQMWCTSMIGGGCEHLSKNFVSFAASIAQIARGEKSHTQLITHSLSHSLTQLIWCPGNWSHFRIDASLRNACCPRPMHRRPHSRHGCGALVYVKCGWIPTASPRIGKNSGKVLRQYFAYGRVSWQDN